MGQSGKEEEEEESISRNTCLLGLTFTQLVAGPGRRLGEKLSKTED